MLFLLAYRPNSFSAEEKTAGRSIEAEWLVESKAAHEAEKEIARKKGRFSWTAVDQGDSGCRLAETIPWPQLHVVVRLVKVYKYAMKIKDKNYSKSYLCLQGLPYFICFKCDPIFLKC